MRKENIENSARKVQLLKNYTLDTPLAERAQQYGEVLQEDLAETYEAVPLTEENSAMVDNQPNLRRGQRGCTLGCTSPESGKKKTLKKRIAKETLVNPPLFKIPQQHPSMLHQLSNCSTKSGFSEDANFSNSSVCRNLNQDFDSFSKEQNVQIPALSTSATNRSSDLHQNYEDVCPPTLAPQNVFDSSETQNISAQPRPKFAFSPAFEQKPNSRPSSLASRIYAIKADAYNQARSNDVGDLLGQTFSILDSSHGSSKIMSDSAPFGQCSQPEARTEQVQGHQRPNQKLGGQFTTLSKQTTSVIGAASGREMKFLNLQQADQAEHESILPDTEILSNTVISPLADFSSFENRWSKDSFSDEVPSAVDVAKIRKSVRGGKVRKAGAKLHRSKAIVKDTCASMAKRCLLKLRLSSQVPTSNVPHQNSNHSRAADTQIEFNEAAKQNKSQIRQSSNSVIDISELGLTKDINPLSNPVLANLILTTQNRDRAQEQIGPDGKVTSFLNFKTLWEQPSGEIAQRFQRMSGEREGQAPRGPGAISSSQRTPASISQ